MKVEPSKIKSQNHPRLNHLDISGSAFGLQGEPRVGLLLLLLLLLLQLLLLLLLLPLLVIVLLVVLVLVITRTSTSTGTNSSSTTTTTTTAAATTSTTTTTERPPQLRFAAKYNRSDEDCHHWGSYHHPKLRRGGCHYASLIMAKALPGRSAKIQDSFKS